VVVSRIVSVKVATLTHAVVKAMWMTKLKTVIAMGLLVIAGIGMVACSALAQRESERTPGREAPKTNLGESVRRGEGPTLRTTLQGHASFVVGVAFAPDGKTLASASGDQTIKLWDVATGKERSTLRGHKNFALCVAFSPDGKTLATGSYDRTAKLWDVATGKERATLAGHSGAVWSVAFHPDGKTLASASEGEIRLWEVDTGKERASLAGCHPIVFSPDGKALASRVGDNTIRLWELATGRQRATLSSQTDTGSYLNCVALSPGGRLMASGDQSSDTGKVKLWEVSASKERAILRGHTGHVSSVAFSPDGKLLASACLSPPGAATVKVWELGSRECLATFDNAQSVRRVVFSPDGKILASASNDRTIKLWNVPGTRQVDRKNEPARYTRLSARDLETSWDTLAAEDASKAYQAIQRLVEAGPQAIAEIRERLRPTLEPNAETRNLIALLDSEQFAVRQQARMELEKQGERAEAALRQKLKGELPSLEVRRQIEQLLAQIPLSSMSLRALRAVEVLELIGTPDARAMLETLAKGAEGARLTREAKASLDRLNKRATSGW
jgi:dipeptidyl aminopeptidase/acylaminoacyl peptidase